MPVLFKKFKPFESPKKFSFRDPDTKREFIGTSIAHLAEQVRSYRSQNELPPLDLLEVVIENHLCTFPIHVGCCTPIQGPKRTFMQYWKGGIALLKNIAYQSFADQTEADRRSEVCTHCPHNIFPDRGPFLKWADDIAERSVGKLRAKHHNELGICELCTCPIRAKVWTDGKIELTKEQFEQMRNVKEVSCWQVPLAEVK